TSYQDCNLEDNRVYTYWVIAFDDSGNESPPSFMVSGRTISPTEPGPDLLPYQVTIGVLVILVIVLGVLVVQRGKPPDQKHDNAQPGSDRRQW
ncbi:MAG: hypothetical protein ACE5HJ_09175, partial [Thermoplasmata archaeon]